MVYFSQQKSRNWLLAAVLGCLWVQITLADYSLVIKSDTIGESFNGKSPHFIAAERFGGFLYGGVVGLWNPNPSSATPGQKKTLTEYFDLTCGTKLRLWVMVDDNFTAYINGVEVLSGSHWDRIYKKEIDLGNFNIQKCGRAKNQLKIVAQNVDYHASIAYTLEEDKLCMQCAAGKIFSKGICRCALDRAPAETWTYIAPVQIFNHQMDFTEMQVPDFEAKLPADAVNASEYLISASASYTENKGDSRNFIMFEGETGDSSKLLYVMMMYKSEDSVSNSDKYETASAFSVPWVELDSLSIKLGSPVSALSKLALDIIAWR